MDRLTTFIAMLAWLAGIVLANGFWSTLVSFIFPPWAWYVLVEQVLIRLNFFL